jgi:RNA polymerase sigma-70 factor (ECF subfamily)
MFDRYHLAVFRYLWRMTGRRDEAEDLTQEVFVRIMRGVDRYDPRDREQAWVFRIARNLLLDHIRQVRRHPVSGEFDQGFHAQRADQDLAVLLTDALGQLDALDREVFLLREVSGLGYVDIAALCGLTPDAVRNRIFRARCTLRDALRGVHVSPSQ